MKHPQALAILKSIGRERKARRASLDVVSSSRDWYDDEVPTCGANDWCEPWQGTPVTPDVIQQYRRDVNTLRRARSCNMNSPEERQRLREVLVEQLMAEHLWAVCKDDPDKKFLKHRLIDCGIADRYHLKAADLQEARGNGTALAGRVQ